MELTNLRGLGAGALRQAGEDKQLHPIWLEQYTEAQMQGLPFPQFEEWKQLRNQQVSSIGNQY